MKRFVLLCVCLFILLRPVPVLAEQTSSGVAISLPFAEDLGNAGDIICNTISGAVPCSKPYDPTMIGVLVINPAVSLERADQSATLSGSMYRPVISMGKAYVRVKKAEGGIQKGNLITSSETSGLGQKVEKSGYTLGIALEDTTFDVNESEKTILVALSIRPSFFSTTAKTNLIQLVREGVEGTYSSPLSALRFLLAASITLLSILLGFLFFGKVARSGVEAIGRNPLAGKMIQVTVVFNVILTIGIMAAGVSISYFILVL